MSETRALLGNLRSLLSPNGTAVVTVLSNFSPLQQELPDNLAYFDTSCLMASCEARGWNCLEMLAKFPVDWLLLKSESNDVVKRRGGGPCPYRSERSSESPPTATVDALCSYPTDAGRVEN